MHHPPPRTTSRDPHWLPPTANSWELHCLRLCLCRWVHRVGRADVLEGDARQGRRRGGTASVYYTRIRDKRPEGTTGDGNIPTTVLVVQIATKHRLLHFPNIFAEHTHRHAVLGVLLDQPRSYEREGGSRYVYVHRFITFFKVSRCPISIHIHPTSALSKNLSALFFHLLNIPSFSLATLFLTSFGFHVIVAFGRLLFSILWTCPYHISCFGLM